MRDDVNDTANAAYFKDFAASSYRTIIGAITLRISGRRRRRVNIPYTHYDISHTKASTFAQRNKCRGVCVCVQRGS